MSAISEPILNILVVGFHHKKGCQVEFCYPQLISESPNELPPVWKHLPALALPDGSHNYHSDTIFFHLPSLTQPSHTVYAISCFRQIPIEQVSQRTSDMTRSSVQKSVCVISKEPLFGHLAIKLELVVRAWFRRGDFCCTQLLEDAYKHLNGCPTLTEQVFEGLSALNLVETWRHKSVLLFKLILLQRKVVLHGSPAGLVSAFLLTLLSLFPECIQNGLRKSANIILSRPLSPNPNDANKSIVSNSQNKSHYELQENENSLDVDESIEIKEKSFLNDSLSNNFLADKDDKTDYSLGENSDIGEREKCHSVGEKYKSVKTLSESHSTPSMVRDMSVNGLTNLAASVEFTECGFPLNLFSEGYLCLPYLSLQYMDLISDPAVKGFLIGASNVLFKQKRQLFDVLVESADLRIEAADFNLRRQLQLSTEDLRFADHLVRHGSLQGDEWIRDQFYGYLLCLLRTSLLSDGSRELDHFNSCFMSAFKTTDVYKEWLVTIEKDVNDIFTNMPPGHPFAGQLSVTDMKLRLAHTMSSTESGRKMTQAVVSTGRAVASTSRVVGGALSQAKGALSVWWNTLTTPSPQAETAPATESDFEVLDTTSKDVKATSSNTDNSYDSIMIKKDSSGNFIKVNPREIDKIPNSVKNDSDTDKTKNIDNIIDQSYITTDIINS